VPAHCFGELDRAGRPGRTSGARPPARPGVATPGAGETPAPTKPNPSRAVPAQVDFKPPYQPLQRRTNKLCIAFINFRGKPPCSSNSNRI
jgi:hypothetical protein